MKKIIDEITQVISKEFHVLGSSMEKTVKKMNIEIIKVDKIDDILDGTIRKNDKTTKNRFFLHRYTTIAFYRYYRSSSRF